VVQHRGEHDHQRRGDPVDGPPARQRSHGAGHGARQQDADDQAAHDRTDHAATLVVERQPGGDRYEDLGHDRRETYEANGGGEEADGGCHRGRGKARRRDRSQRRDQPPTLEKVSQGEQQDEARGVADLGHRDDQPGDGGAHAKLVAQGLEERLGKVVTGDRLPASQPRARRSVVGRTQATQVVTPKTA
jgi:hypothetical protein